jgi:hypothetical protein
MTETVGLESDMVKDFFSLKKESRNQYILETELVISQRYNRVPAVSREMFRAKQLHGKAVIPTSTNKMKNIGRGQF